MRSGGFGSLCEKYILIKMKCPPFPESGIVRKDFLQVGRTSNYILPSKAAKKVSGGEFQVL